ncbi:aminotransferase class IV [Planctomicrobium piriforme]|uniref:branched-chain-amino-acid transaminase n=1 Tax=Planctomicrobium piriforme TaxID=1576369 RepID=A0A1I3J0X4_9PLAN|nr:aminotransferase class IV [Planctomicrobium piriforme]SFI53874.1 D-alanine transaminase/branched-chain amino acid aminotransferase [Planctomicrobium piriforme]
MSLSVSEPVASLNGELIPFSEAKLPIYDLGVMQGATVTERLRTVAHRPYLVAEHLARLRNSLFATGIHMPLDSGPLEDVIAEVARLNCALIGPHDDLAVVIFVTAGQSLTDSNGLVDRSRGTVCVYTAPLPLAHWQPWYEHGLALVVPGIEQIPASSIPPQIKHRSRMNWFLADRVARQVDPHAMALLCDQNGFVTESSSGNLFVVRQNRLQTPRAETTLPGIAQAHVIELATHQGWQVERCDLTIEDVADADEVFMTSSTYCLVPVRSINGQSIGKALPGHVTKMLLDCWSAELGFSLSAQAARAGHDEPEA